MHGEEVMSHLLSYCLCLLCQIDCMHVRQHAQRQHSEHFAQNNFSSPAYRLEIHHIFAYMPIFFDDCK